MSTQQSDLLETAKTSQMANYRPAPFVVAKGAGCEVWDVAGKRYLDLSAGIAVTSVGHCHPHLVSAIAKQASSLMHVSNLFYNEPAITLGQRLVEKTGFARVYFCNSGTEAVESCLKLARYHHYAAGDTTRTGLVATDKSFHGRTMGALTVTGQPKYHKGMEPLIGDVGHVPYNDLAAMDKAITDKTAGVIVEPLQAEGGIHPAAEGYLEGLRKLCDERGALLIFDEVQTGYGRTGKFLGREWSGVMPDACSLAKGIGGGFPLGAMLIADKVVGSLPPGTHASTFGGNPLASAAGNAVLDIFESEDLVAACASRSVDLKAMLRALVDDPELPVTALRGQGLLIGLQLADGIEARPLLTALQQAGLLLTIAGGTVLRFSPALTVSVAELTEGVAILKRVLASA